MERIYIPLALKLHAYGLSKLHDPNWTGCVLFDRLKQHVRGRIEPSNMLHKTLSNGLLYHIGIWILEDYIDTDNNLLEELSDEYRAWYLEDIVEAIIKFDEQYNDSQSVRNAKELLHKLDDLYNSSDDIEYFAYLDSEDGINALSNCYDHLLEEFASSMPDFTNAYALNYAERVFHDRQLCGFISELLVTIGFDGMDSPGDTKPRQWIDHIKWPSWASKAVRARDRGCCANCSRNLSQELVDDENVDHIVPLSKAGTNDLVNLQLLCKTCNQNKYNKLNKVNSSIPPYLRNTKGRKA